MNPIILSFDVGIIHLAYCLFTKEDDKLKIIDWNNIDLTDREDTKCFCGLKAVFIQNNIYYCKVHSKKLEIIKKFEEIYTSIEKNNNICSFTNCTKKCSINYNLTDINYCIPHAKKEYKELDKKLKIKKYKVTNVNALDFDNTRMKLITILDSKKELLMRADVVCIENQPSLVNPLMKSIACTLYDYFLIRGIIDKNLTNSNIKKVKFIAPSNKIKLIDDENTKKIIINKDTDKTVKYKLTKALAIKYTTDLISHLVLWNDFFSKQKKKDDLADSLLQGLYYYEKNEKVII